MNCSANTQSLEEEYDFLVLRQLGCRAGKPAGYSRDPESHAVEARVAEDRDGGVQDRVPVHGIKATGAV